MEFDPIFLSRVQFAFVVSFHILFPAFTIGLASFIVVLEGLWLKTGDRLYFDYAQFWTRIFAVSFGMGVVSGIVMSYQFGTNWSTFSFAVANIIGPLLGYEVFTAFFLEATFLGVLLFGRDRVPPGLHFVSAVAVAFGTLFSAFWILSANSWMQTPAGYTIDENGVFFPADWWAIIFNPSFPYRFAHMVTAAYLTTAFVVIGVSAWYLLKKRFHSQARLGLKLGLGFVAIMAPLQVILGDLHGLNTFEYQPAKVAAMEGHWEEQEGAPAILFAIPDEEAETNHWQIAVPYLGSIILTHEVMGTVHGLKAYPPEDRPPVAVVFWTFRLMVLIGFWMVFIAWRGYYLHRKGRLDESRGFLRMCAASLPIGFIAILAGWFTTEIGRQPWVVQDLMRTADAASPLPGGTVAASLVGFVVAYTIIFGFGVYYLAKIVRIGPRPHRPTVEARTPQRPLSGADQRMDEEE